MKNLEKIFMLLGFIGAAFSFGIAIYQHTSWNWQLITMAWIFVVYIKTIIINRYEKLIQKMTK
jgi:hypothetical protein